MDENARKRIRDLPTEILSDRRKPKATAGPLPEEPTAANELMPNGLTRAQHEANMQRIRD